MPLQSDMLEPCPDALLFRKEIQCIDCFGGVTWPGCFLQELVLCFYCLFYPILNPRRSKVAAHRVGETSVILDVLVLC